MEGERDSEAIKGGRQITASSSHRDIIDTDTYTYN